MNINSLFWKSLKQSHRRETTIFQSDLLNDTYKWYTRPCIVEMMWTLLNNASVYKDNNCSSSLTYDSAAAGKTSKKKETSHKYVALNKQGGRYLNVSMPPFITISKVNKHKR